MRHGVVVASRGIIVGPLLLASFALSPQRLSAQTLSVTSLTNASDADLHTEEGAAGPASLCDAQRRSAGPAVTASTATSFTTRFRHGLGADCGQVAGDEFMVHSLNYSVGFNATCPVGYGAVATPADRSNRGGALDDAGEIEPAGKRAEGAAVIPAEP
jgi:hypothetical protein